MRHLSGLISPPSIASPGLARWISSWRAGPVPRTAWLADVVARPIRAISGPMLIESSRRFVLDSFSERTSQASLLTLMGLSEADETSSDLGTELRQLSSQRRRWAQATNGSVSFSSPWPTPDTAVGGPESATRKQELGRPPTGSDLMAVADTWATPSAADDVGTHGGGQGRSLRTDIAQPQWQTPATDSFRSRGGERKDEQGLDQQSRLWPSPRAENAEEIGNHPGQRDSLNAEAGLWGTPMSNESTHAPRPVDHGRQLANQVDSWTTPQARDEKNPSPLEGQRLKRGALRDRTMDLNDQAPLWPTPNQRDYKGQDLSSRHGGASLSHFAETGERIHEDWPTPNAHDSEDSGSRVTGYLGPMVKAHPGTSLTDATSRSTPPHLEPETSGGGFLRSTGAYHRLLAYASCGNKRLEKLARRAIQRTGSRNGFTARRLNAVFVAWLMCWSCPSGPGGSVYSETASYHYRRRMRSSLLSLVGR